MKKANFTSIPQEWLSRLGRTGMMMLACCLISFTVTAQSGGILVTGDSTYDPTDDEWTHTCGGSTIVTDGGGATNQYEDTAASSSSVTICPDMNSMQVLKIQFQSFDLEDGDVLTVADENQVHVSVTGSSVANSPNGGWVIGDCEDYSGCLTIQFDTDGDSSKGAGFVAEITCQDRDVAFDCPYAGQTFYEVATCDFETGPDFEFQYPFGSEVFFPLPTWDVCGVEGDIIISTGCANGAFPTFTDAVITDLGNGDYLLTGGTGVYVFFPLGQYELCFIGAPPNYDPNSGPNPFADKECCVDIYIVQPPLVCNDDLNVSVDQACTVVVTADLMLEDPCLPEELGADNDGDGNVDLYYEVVLSEADVPGIGTLPNLIGTTDEGYPIYDFSAVECGTRFDVCITRYVQNFACVDNEPDYLVDKCWGRILVEDKVPPVLVGADQVVTVPCYLEDQVLGFYGAELEDVLSQLVSNPYSIYDVVDNCSNSLQIGAWVQETVDCTGGGFDGLDPDGNGIADDVIWDIMAVEMGPEAVFTCYYRVIRAVDACGAVSSNFHLQGVCVTQPDIVFPEIEIEVPCGTDIDPVAIYELWASDPGWYPELSTWIPNYDPTPLEVNLGDAAGTGGQLGNLEDTYFTDVSGDEVPADPRDHAACGYAIDWIDGNEVEICDGGGAYKLFRDWTVYNWCDGHLELIDIVPQVIKVGDSSAPIIDDFVQWYQGGSPYNDCAADLIMTPPDVYDECSGVTQLFVSVQGVTVVNGDVIFGEASEEIEVTPGVEITIPNVAIGYFFLDFRAIDACGNESTYTDANYFFDDISPVAICETSHTVSLGSGESLYSVYQGYGEDSDCAVVVPAEVFDDGSYDNCGAVQFSVARMDSDSDGDGFPEDDDYGDFVVFTADDLEDGCTGATRVVFRVNDLSAYDFNGDGEINGEDDIDLTISANGIDLPRTVDNDGENVNFCMVDVIVQDKLSPLALGFQEVLKCNDPSVDDLVQASLSDDPIGAVLDFALSEFGFLSSFPTDNCEQYNGGELLAADFSGFDATCREGVVTYKVRWFDLCDNPSNIVDIQYVVVPCSDWKMTFPLDAQLYCEDGEGLPAPATLGEILTNDGCDFWGLEVNSETFEAQEGACYKMVREYHLINWCSWNPSNTETAVVERPCGPIDEGDQVSLRFCDDYLNAAAYDLDGNGVAEVLVDANGNPVYNAPYAVVYDWDADGVPDAQDSNIVGQFAYDLDGDGAPDSPQPTTATLASLGLDNLDPNDYVGGDGVNDTDDGNENKDYITYKDLDVQQLNGDVGYTSVPNRIYTDFPGCGAGNLSYLDIWNLIGGELQDCHTAFDALSIYDPCRRRGRTYDEFINDPAEAACDIYDATSLQNDGDFVIVDRYDSPHGVGTDDNFPAGLSNFIEFSQFTGEFESYVSAQFYGNIMYRQVLKVSDATAPTLNITQNGPYCGGDEADADGNCVGNVDFKFSVADPCSPNLTVTHSLRPFGGSEINDPFAIAETTGENEYRIAGTYPIGAHSFVIEVIDGCGNVERQTIEFEVKDCKAPTAYCIFGLSADLMPTGMVELWASDFDAGSNDLCSDVTLTFADPTLYPDSINRVFECANGEIGTVEVQLWAQDAAGNTSYCTTFVNVQANQANTNCPGNGAAIAGEVATEGGEMVENVEVSLSGNVSAEAMTANDGAFMFAGLEAGYDYSLTPQRDDNPLNGVSTFDLVLISKHILGVDLLDSPYKLIAADVNNSGSVTTFDMVELRKVILNIESDFTNNTSWRFVAADYDFANPANPFGEAFPEVMNFNNLNSDHLNAEFVAIKVGDVNGNAVANSLLGTEGRGATSFGLNVENRVLKAGETTTVTFTGDLSTISGYQFTLDYTGLELVDIVEGAAKVANFGKFNGQVTASWNDNVDATEAFGLTFTATEDIVLSQALSLNSSRTAAEAYTRNGEVQNVALNFNAAGFALYQNTPNPFDEVTVVSFSLPTAEQGTLTVSDAAGKVLKVINANFVEGYNEIELTAKTLAPGVLSYTLATKEFTATKKMVILD